QTPSRSRISCIRSRGTAPRPSAPVWPRRSGSATCRWPTPTCPPASRPAAPTTRRTRRRSTAATTRATPTTRPSADPRRAAVGPWSGGGAPRGGDAGPWCVRAGGSETRADAAAEVPLVVGVQLDLLDLLAGAGRVDHVAVAGVDAHVRSPAVEEQEVALDGPLPGDLLLDRAVDLLAGAGELHPGLAPGASRQAGAVP